MDFLQDQNLADDDRQATPYLNTLKEHVARDVEAGDNNTLAITSQGGLWASTHQGLSLNQPISKVTMIVRAHWFVALEAAKNYNWRNTKHDHLVCLILGTQDLGTLLRNSTPVETSDGLLWSDLPYFVKDTMKTLKELIQSPEAPQLLNLTAFLAKSTAVGISSNEIAITALLLFHYALESPIENRVLGHYIPIFYAWIRFASSKLALLSARSFVPKSDEKCLEPGELAQLSGVTCQAFSIKRWNFWLERITELAAQEDDNNTAHKEHITTQPEDVPWIASASRCRNIMKSANKILESVRIDRNS
jgi:hypothetical protein